MTRFRKPGSSLQRRRFLKTGITGTAATLLSSWPLQALIAQQDSGTANNDDWNSGLVRHLLPAVSDTRMMIKASFSNPLGVPPVLRIQGSDQSRSITGHMNDTAGLFWQFYLEDLRPDQNYQLSLSDGQGSLLCDSWPLKTFPAPEQRPDHVRVMFYTCAGGAEGEYFGIGDRRGNLPTHLRNRLLRRGLSFQPDAVIANGDHIYWDLHTWQGEDAGELSRAGLTSDFQYDKSVWGRHNEAAIKAAAGPQILPVYGTDFRSTPMFFLQDDHDHWENDSPLTYPVPWFQLQLARATQQLYYPEFLTDSNRPDGLPWSGRSERGELSESFGTLRYGDLLEVLLYDVRRTLSVGELNAAFLDHTVEDWLIQRTSDNDTRHLVHVPSNPPGWTAGKWGEWYPDMLDARNARLTLNIPKPHWRQGWLDQHDRLMQSLHLNRERTPLVIAGDLHATGAGIMHGAGSHDFSSNPVNIILSGPIGTSIRGFPSVVRGVASSPSAYLDFEESVAAIEQHGFTIVDFERDAITAQLFKWDVNSQAVEAMDTLEPYFVTRYSR